MKPGIGPHIGETYQLHRVHLLYRRGYLRQVASIAARRDRDRRSAGYVERVVLAERVRRTVNGRDRRPSQRHETGLPVAGLYRDRRLAGIEDHAAVVQMPRRGRPTRRDGRGASFARVSIADDAGVWRDRMQFHLQCPYATTGAANAGAAT